MARSKTKTLPVERERRILEILQERGLVRIHEIHSIFGVSKMTLWRDIQSLMKKHGDIVPLHGGIMLDTGGLNEKEDSIEGRKKLNSDGKTAIAKKAAELIKDGMTVILDASSSSYFLAQELNPFSGLTVVTNCIDIAYSLRKFNGVEVVVPGGHLKKETSSLIGPQTRDFLLGISADLCFFSVSGLSPDGELMDINPMEIEVKRAMIAAAEESVLLLDSTKFGRGRGAYRVMRIDEVSRVVSDRPLPGPKKVRGGRVLPKKPR